MSETKEEKVPSNLDDIFSKSTALVITGIAVVFVIFAMSGWANESFFSAVKWVVSLASVYFLGAGVFFKKWNSLWAPAFLLYIFNPITVVFTGDWIIFDIFAVITFLFTWTYHYNMKYDY